MRRARGWGVTMGRGTLQRQRQNRQPRAVPLLRLYGRAGPATAEPQATNVECESLSGQHYVHAHITQERAPSWQHHKSRKHKAWEAHRSSHKTRPHAGNANTHFTKIVSLHSFFVSTSHKQRQA